jgi:ketosteroid isomerase-like protein
MNTSVAGRVESPLDEPPQQFAAEPFYGETLTLLRSVRDHDFAMLSHLCDDDFGIVDVDPAGNARPIRTRAEWEAWFHELFATLDAMSARTDSIVLDYHAVRESELGYSVLEFRQTLTVGSHTATFDCVATIIWKQTVRGWREARWHASVISSDIPDELRQPT